MPSVGVPVARLVHVACVGPIPFPEITFHCGKAGLDASFLQFIVGWINIFDLLMDQGIWILAGIVSQPCSRFSVDY